LAIESGSKVKVKFLVKDQTDYSEIFMVATNISPLQNIKKLAWRFSLNWRKKSLNFF
jgi:hypothetical protein